MSEKTFSDNPKPPEDQSKPKEKEKDDTKGHICPSRGENVDTVYHKYCPICDKRS